MEFRFGSLTFANSTVASRLKDFQLRVRTVRYPWVDTDSGSLWLRSNLTFRVEKGATLIGSTRWAAYPMVYTRSSCTMMEDRPSVEESGRPGRACGGGGGEQCRGRV